jgi:hypothetical protein
MRDVPLRESVERGFADGFEYFEVGLSEERLPETREILSSVPVKLIAQGWASTVDEATVFFERAASLGAAAINLHLGHAYLAMEEAAGVVLEAIDKAREYNLPLMLETHRGRLTQDLYRTSQLALRVPDLLIALDVSHYIVAGETLGGSEPLFRAHLRPITSKAALIHGRISNGASIQVSVDDPFACVATTTAIWQEAMESWLQDAPEDAVMLFEPELGPPPYAYLNSQQKETFSRDDQSTILRALALETWERATKNVRPKTA